MKRIVGVLLVGCLLVTMFGCEKEKSKPDNSASYVYEEEETYTPFDEIRMFDVDSSCFSEVGYAESTETLYVRFKDSGSLYRYDEIPRDVYKALINADSIGGYYNSNIKGEYPSTRIYE